MESAYTCLNCFICNLIVGIRHFGGVVFVNGSIFFAVFVGKHCNFRVGKNAYSVICNLLLDLREEFGLTYLFISHNLSLIKHITDHMSVMYLGEVRESGRTEEIFENPQTPYTEALMSAILEVNPSKARERIILTGEARSPIDPPDLCRFANRCPKACEKCRTVPLPPAMSVGEEHMARCHRIGNGE